MYIAIGGEDRSRFYGRSLRGGWGGAGDFTVDPEKLHAILISVVLPISISQHYKKNYRVSDSENWKKKNIRPTFHLVWDGLSS